jgi:glutathione peroxidase
MAASLFGASGVLDFTLNSLDGKPAPLAEYRGKVVLIVNVASRCGYTPQYTGLEKIYEKYKDQGFVILGFPANNFGGQEPGTNDEIAEFCTTTYSVTFPLFAKISVVGEDQHPLYAELTSQVPTADGKDAFRENLRSYDMTPTEDPDVLWNFEKFLVSRQGEVVGRFAPTVRPDDPLLLEAIEAELSK